MAGTSVAPASSTRSLAVIAVAAFVLLAAFSTLGTIAGVPSTASSGGHPEASRIHAPPPGAAGTLALTPTNGTVGETVNASGTGYAPDSTITLEYDGVGVPTSCTADGTGTFPGTSGTPCTFVVPPSPAGAANVTAIGSAFSASFVPVGGGTDGVAYDGGNHDAYVANSITDNVSVVNVSTGLVVATVPVGSSPIAITYDPAAGQLWVVNSISDNVSVISDASETIIATVAVGSSPGGIAYDSGTGQMFVTDSGANNVSVVDVSNDTVVANVPTGSDPQGVAYDSGTGQLFVANDASDNLSVISDATDTIAATVAVGCGPAGVAYDPALAEIFDAEDCSHSVSVTSDTNDSVVATVLVTPGSSASDVVCDAATAQVFVTQPGLGLMSAIQTANNSVVASLTIGTSFGVDGLAYDGSTAQVLVANGVNNSLGVVTQGTAVNASATFAVTPTLALAPSMGRTGATVQASGLGFAASATLSFTFGGSPVSSNCSSDATGSFPGTTATPCTLTVPTLTGGTQVVTASDGTNQASANFTPLTMLALAPSNGPQGTSVAATGTGFAANTSIAFTFNGSAVASNCSTDATGSFPGATGSACTFTVPAAPVGSYTVSATDGARFANATFRVHPDLTLTPANGTVGSTVAVSGSGFAADSGIAFSLAGTSLATPCRTDATGAFPGTSGTSCAFVVPSMPGGPELFGASDGVTMGSVSFTILGNFSVSPAMGAFGATVTATGAGFSANATIGFSVGGVSVPSNCSTDALGVFPGSTGTPCSFTVPSVPGGNETILAFRLSSNVSTNVGGDPSAIAYDSASGELFVANQNNATLSVIADANGTVVDTIPLPLGGGVDAAVYDSGTNQVFVADQYSNCLSVVDASNDTIVANPGTGGQPAALAYDSGLGEIFSVNWGSNNVTVLSDTTDDSVANIPVGSAPIGIAYDPLTGDLFVTNYYANTVSVISDATNAVVATVPVGSYPLGAAVDLATGDVYVTNDGSNNVSVISDVSDAVVATVPVGHYPNSAAYVPGLGEILVANGGTDNVTAIAAATEAVVGNYSVGQTPDALAYDGGTQELFVANSNSDNVSVIAFGTPARTTFLVRASLLANATARSVDVGQTATLSGFGFGANATITSFSMGAAALACTGATVGSCVSGVLATNASGAFRADFVVPTVASSGNYTVTVSDQGGDSAQIEYAVYVDPAVAPPISSASSLDLGQSTLLDVTASFGSGVYSYAWNDLPTGCASRLAEFNCTPTATGTFAISVTVTDSNGASAASASIVMTVYPDPTVSLSLESPTSGYVDAGQSVTLAADAADGTGSYTYFTWSQLPDGCGGTSAMVTCAGADLIAGTYPITVTVTDSNGFVSTASAPLSLTVGVDPTVSVPTANRSSADVGQHVTFSVTASPSSASAGFDYVWSDLPTGCQPAAQASIACRATAAGNFSIQVRVTDRASYNATSAVLAFEVFGDPTASLTVNRTAIDLGQAVALTAAVTGGSPTDTYAWSGLPAGCAGSASVLECTPGAVGHFSPKVTVTDSNGFEAVPATVVFTVAEPLAAAVNATPSSPAAGQLVNFSAIVSGGTGPVSYAWDFGSGPIATGASVEHAFSSAGAYVVTFWANDSAGGIVEKTLTVSVGSRSSGSGALGAPSTSTLVGLGVVIALAIGIGAFLVLRHRAPRGGSPVRDADPTEPVAASPPVGDPENEPEE